MYLEFFEDKSTLYFPEQIGIVLEKNIIGYQLSTNYINLVSTRTKNNKKRCKV